jgi:tRNA nucleotidyltransferase (CCA-adding enzyme)
VDLITTHLTADFDGLASMVAARKLYPGAVLVFPGGTQETVRSFLAVHDLGIARLKDVSLEQITRLVLVDTQEPERIGPLKGVYADPRVTVHVYDHHPDADQQSHDGTRSRAALRVVEPVGATATILVERLKEQQLPLTSFEATVLAIGLYEETGSLAYASTTPRDLEAVALLLRAGADLNVVSDTLRRHLDPDQIAILNDLLHHGETYYLDGRKVLLATSTYDRYRGDLAEVVHRLAEMEGLDVVVAAVSMDDKVEIIGRSRRPGIDVGRLLQEFGGGGHAVAAAASVKGQPLVEVKERLVHLLTGRFRPTLMAKDVMTKPVKAIGEDATVTEAESRMTKYGVNVLPVLDSREHYRGLITREIVQKALFHGFGESPVQSFMQADQYTAGPETPFHEIEVRMVERNQRFVPILAEASVIGVVTRTDLLRTLHDDVLAAARARAKGQEAASPPSYTHRRNIRGTLKERLPAGVFALLEQAGRLADQLGVSVFAVGGFVRDLLLGIGNLDLDMVVEGDGIAFARALGRGKGAHIRVHERFGTAVAIFPDGLKLDIATARTEYYEYPTALPTVERSSIKKDLYRRDFTINTLAVCLNTSRFGDLVDFYGGQRDLKEQTIRVLHSLSFVEDPTRVFRAVRFELRFGFRMSKETLVLVKGAVKMDLFHRLSGHRLLEELVLLFSEEEPRRAVARLGELDLLRFIHPSLEWSPRLNGLLKGVEDALDWYKLLYLDRKMETWLVFFMAIMEVIPAKGVAETLKRLSIPARQAEKIRAGRFSSNAVLRRLFGRRPLKPAETYRVLCGLTDETLLLLMAKTDSEAVKRQVSAYVTTYQHVTPALTGADLKALGLKPGPQYKKILEALLDARLNGEVKTEAEERGLVMRIVRDRTEGVPPHPSGTVPRGGEP